MVKKNSLLILIVAVLVLIIVIGIVFYFIMGSSQNKDEKSVLKIDKNIIMYAFDDSFVGNVKDSKKMIKITIELELANQKIEELVNARKAEIKDKINLILRSKTELDLSGPEGQILLKKEILEAVRKILLTDKVLNVYFNEFIVQ